MSPEDRLQIAYIQWLELEWGPFPKVLYSASAGGMRTSIGTAKKMKAMGYKKGTPDITIYEPKGKYLALFIEMKTKKGEYGAKSKGTVKEHQKEFLTQLNDRGYYAVPAWGLDEAIELTNKYLTEKL